MKKIVILLVGVLMTLSACQDEDSPAFSKSADERVSEAVGTYSAMLKTPQYGWKATYFPDSVYYGGWSFWVKFGEDGKVTMLSDQDGTTCKTKVDSHYRLGAIHTPTLSFDTYNYLHYMSDPRYGVRGRGYGGDFEFSFDKAKSDTIYLKALTGKSRLMLVAASAPDTLVSANYTNLSTTGTLFDSNTMPYFKILTIGTTKVELAYSSYYRQMSFKYLKEGSYVTEYRGVAFLNNGLELITPLYLPGIAFPIKVIPFTIDSPTHFTVDLPQLGLTGSIEASNLPAFQYTQGVKDLQRETIMIYNGGSTYGGLTSLSTHYSNLRKAVGTTTFKSLQFYYNYDGHNGLGIFTTTKVRYFYDLEWTYGVDGVLRAKYLGTTNGAAYEAKMKPIIDKLCNPDGWTVLDFAKNTLLGLNYYTVAIVSRTDSRDFMVLASQSF